MLFSDKCTMHEFVPRHMHFRRSLGKCFDKKYVVATMKHPPSQMIWGDMLYRDAVGLYFIPPNTAVNGPMYMELVREKLKLHLHVHGYTIFMQDDIPCHQSKVATEFLKKHKISLLEWPGNSPDLNQIDNMWTILKDKVAYKQPSIAKKLRQVIKEVWITEITQDYYKYLVSSMPRRIQAVIDSKGGHTNC